MVVNTQDPDQCKNVDFTCIKQYNSYYIRQNRSKPLLKFFSNAKAPVEHLFNDRTWCDPLWCWAKEVAAKKMRLCLQLQIERLVTMCTFLPSHLILSNIDLL